MELERHLAEGQTERLVAPGDSDGAVDHQRFRGGRERLSDGIVPEQAADAA